MEIQTLRNFLEIAREGSMTAAANTLHVSQPSLSKQIKELEKELGKKLFKRGSRNVTLTDEGMLLRKRAEDILAMIDKTTDEFKELDVIKGGDIRIGCAESYLIKHLASSIRDFKKDYPLLRYHLTSGDTVQVIERLDNGLLDFAIIVEPPVLSKYNYLEVPGTDTWGVAMLKNDSLASKEFIRVDDLIGRELICSEQSVAADLPRWCGEGVDKLNITGNTNLFFNGSVFVKEGLGLLLTFEHLITDNESTQLTFRRFEPILENKMYIIWKKYQIFTPIAELFIKKLTQDFK